MSVARGISSIGRARLSSVHGGVRWLLVLLVLTQLGGVEAARAQGLKVEAPETVLVGRPFQVTFTTESRVKNFGPPLWGGISVLSGPEISSRSGVQIINGQVTKQFSSSLTYWCRVDKEGTYEVGRAKVETRDATFESEPFSIKAVSSGAGAPGQSAGSGSTNATPETATVDKVDGKDIFVSINLSNKRVYQGQPIVATLKIYTRLDLVALEGVQVPDFKGFWSKEIDTPRQITFSREVVNGNEYNAGVLRQYLLYPQKSGSIDIDPLEVTVRYRVRDRRSSFFDDFMGSFQSESVALRSSKPTVQVLPLPDGKPQSFSGAVGDYSVTATVDKSDVLTNEAFTYRLTISGSGNMELLPMPELEFPSIVEAFPPTVKPKFSVKRGTQAGNVTYEYVLIPRVEGVVKLPSYTFSYFNPADKQYKKATTEEFTINVTLDSTQPAPVVSGTVNKEDIQLLSTDIRHISLKNSRWEPVRYTFIGSRSWWTLLLSILLVFVGGWAFLKRGQMLQSDQTKFRSRRALRGARKRMKKVQACIDVDNLSFYDELLRALTGYLSEKLDLNLVDMSSSAISSVLQTKGVDEKDVSSLNEIIEICEFAKYSPDKTHQQKEQIYRQALTAIEAIDDQL